MKKHIDHDQNVFINCPFDEVYEPIFDAILFTVHRCGFILRCAKEFDDSSGIRISNIIQLINECKYSIHDLSRATYTDLDPLPRFNMPLELGITIGALHFGNKMQKSKNYLILESEKFRFKKIISDISGQDIKNHNNDPFESIKVVRNWLAFKKPTTKIPSPSIIIEEYNNFLIDLPEICIENKWISNELTYIEMKELIISYLTTT